MRTIAIAIAASIVAFPAMAEKHMKQGEGMDHGSMKGMDHSKMDGIHTPATINSIDGMTVNVTHPAIPDLKWPPMTMDMMLLDGAKVGDVKAGDEAMLMLEKGEDGMVGIRAMMPAE